LAHIVAQFSPAFVWVAVPAQKLLTMLLTETAPDLTGSRGDAEIVVEEHPFYPQRLQPAQRLGVLGGGGNMQGCAGERTAVRAHSQSPVPRRSQRDFARFCPERIPWVTQWHVDHMCLHTKPLNARTQVLNSLGRVNVADRIESEFARNPGLNHLQQRAGDMLRFCPVDEIKVRFRLLNGQFRHVSLVDPVGGGDDPAVRRLPEKFRVNPPVAAFTSSIR